MKSYLLIFGLHFIFSMSCAYNADTSTINTHKSRSQKSDTQTMANSKYWNIIPGKSIGPIELGMKKERVNTVMTFAPHPKYSAMTIPISANYSDESVSSIEISLLHIEKDIQIGEVIIPRSSTIEEIKTLLGDCEESDVRFGGTIIPCRKGGLSISVGSASPEETWLRVDSI